MKEKDHCEQIQRRIDYRERNPNNIEITEGKRGREGRRRGQGGCEWRQASWESDNDQCPEQRD